MRPQITSADVLIDQSLVANSVQWLCEVLDAWRSISLRRWLWTTGIAVVLLVANAMGTITSVLGMDRATWGMGGWGASEIVTRVVSGVLGAYFYLLALTIAEIGVLRPQRPSRRYFVAAVVATIAAAALDTSLLAILPSFGMDGWHQAPWFIWFATSWALGGGLAVAVYARFQAARNAREVFHAAELERAAASRGMLASRLAAMQAQVEPEFLRGTLAQVEGLYERDPVSGVRMLDGLIAYLRAALPQLRSEGSTLEREARLADSYLRVIKLRMGSRLDFAIEVPSALAECTFPPMLLLPLIDDALRNGLEPTPLGGRIDIRGRADRNRLHVVVAHDGMTPSEHTSSDHLRATLWERLEGIYGESAHMTFAANTPRGARVEIEVPHETAGAPR